MTPVSGSFPFERNFIFRRIGLTETEFQDIQTDTYTSLVALFEVHFETIDLCFKGHYVLTEISELFPSIYSSGV